ncbi:MAG: hypothetical protein MUF87_18030 [Anaerolineae bacterium]|jgi:hypothetical protein|nr:hypothetical protein [Anaerolineae bacterium]
MLTQSARYLLIVCLSVASLLFTSSSAHAVPFTTSSPFNTPIPANARYTRETRIGTFRPALDRYSTPIYRVPNDQNIPLVRIVNDYSGRVERWPIPVTALPAVGSDHHLIVIQNGISYEMWNARWVNAGRINAGGMYAFPLTDDGITDVPNQRVNSGGWSTLAGLVMREDFLNPTTGQYDPNRRIRHALVISVPRELINQHTFVYPAVATYTGGTAGNAGIPNGARFALPRNLNVDALDVHPFTRELLRAARDYGLYLNDANGTPMINGKYVATVRVEPRLTQRVFGVANDTLTYTIGEQIYQVIQQHGLYRVQ